MKEEKIYCDWTTFINDHHYIEYFMNNNELWHNNLAKVKEFVSDNKYKEYFLSNNKKLLLIKTEKKYHYG